MFTDRIKVQLIAGKGGNGIVAWRRLRYIPKGGPTGGNGGHGASIILKADTQISALDWYRNRRIIKADNGTIGGVNRRQGKRGKDLILKVPCGTLVKDSTTNELLCDLVDDQQIFLICQGGRGGLGNACFATPTNQAPNYSTPGKEGEIKDIELELKLIADVGLVGFPNAGKSTMISAMTNMSSKIGAYPFTTLKPNLGFIELNDYSRIVIADIPGIIEGAHQNRGLGLEFLRHIERTKLLLYVLDISGIDGHQAIDDFTILKGEIRAYNPEMPGKPYLVVLNKMDLIGSNEPIEAFKRAHPIDKDLIFEISASNDQGLEELKHKMASLLMNQSNISVCQAV